jgi:hypothetical protein
VCDISCAHRGVNSSKLFASPSSLIAISIISSSIPRYLSSRCYHPTPYRSSWATTSFSVACKCRRIRPWCRNCRTCAPLSIRAARPATTVVPMRRPMGIGMHACRIRGRSGITPSLTSRPSFQASYRTPDAGDDGADADATTTVVPILVDGDMALSSSTAVPPTTVADASTGSTTMPPFVPPPP